MVAHGCIIQKMVILLRMRLSSTPGRSGQGHTLPPCSTCLRRPGITVRYCNISFTSRTWTAKPCQTIAFRPIASCIYTLYTLYMCRCCFFTSQKGGNLWMFIMFIMFIPFQWSQTCRSLCLCKSKGQIFAAPGVKCRLRRLKSQQYCRRPETFTPNENPP